ncbi:gastrin-releasing peptide [Tursiops truncatus]|uniref:Gastrin-releasing peptide n=1 Tax=Tursiops truncatus TaxID=9739 RepID=A0A2U4BI05_TURTR|nr:gastrin-releasing peptide [Tursiops truncatus]
MIFGDRCPSAPARSRETSERWGRRWRIPLRPRPGLHIKSGHRGGCSSGAGGGGGGAPLRSRSSRLSSAVEAHSPPSLAAALRGLPAGTMRGRDFPLVLLALVLCQAPRGPAAPVSAGGGTLLAKMYPRGNHWAVGHLMGKKSTGESLYVYEGGSLKEQLREYIRWQEATRNLLSLLEAKGTRSHQPPQRVPWAFASPPGIQRAAATLKTWDRGSKLVDSPGSQREGRNPQLN